eukprot:gnl/TRDRNA2_/TRDRNA2_36893_c0_seq1.p1 gnl/TRDRNA2_/TRDRNA2_36893_c0~~gnl/TRDRNA2_/TRDRNA2_36893_c0_seq1.p1  ORF type:complete len:280 (-),score=55.41 gnl/TRDRNA2_/TRDRNA2_36893_c0_seq1:68-907(-)
MGQKISATIHCCQQEALGRPGLELELHDGDAGDITDIATGERFPAIEQQNGFEGFPSLRCEAQRQRWECCRANEDPVEYSNTAGGASMIESLSYVPVRFDESPTIDHDRSQARYSKIVVHSSRARTQRRTKAWEDWLRGATAGRTVTLLSGVQSPRQQAPNTEEPKQSCSKIPATYSLDRALTKLSIVPNEPDSSAISLLIDNIQVICPASDFMLYFDKVDASLDESEKARAVLLQYVTEDTERKRLCFLEESETAKDRFVQALTALWLEKRNDHSMWF